MKTKRYTTFPFFHFGLWAFILVMLLVIPRTPEPQIPQELTADIYFNQYIWQDYYYQMQRYEFESKAYKIFLPLAVFMFTSTGILVAYDSKLRRSPNSDTPNE